MAKAKSAVALLVAALLVIIAGQAQATTAFKLSGSSDGVDNIAVDEDLDVYRNGTQIYTDLTAVAGARAPITVNASPGDVLRFVVRDTYGDCQNLSTIWLTDPATGRNVVADIGFDNGCGFPATNNGVVHDVNFTIPPFSAQPGDLLIVANTAGGFNSFTYIATTDFTTGVELGTFTPDGGKGTLPHAGNGRAVAVIGDNIYYTVLATLDFPFPFGPTDAIRIAPLNGGAGGADTGTIPNPRPGCGISVLDYSAGALYALTGYLGNNLVTCAPREVFKLDPANGNVLAGPVVIGGRTDADGFVVLPNGNFLINTGDAECFYDEFDSTTGAFTGNLIRVPGPSADLTPNFCTGVVTDGTSLYFATGTQFEFFSAVTKTTLTGAFISRVPVDIDEDIALTVAAGGGGNTLTALSPAHLWLGLKNGDDVGTQFDLRVELLKNGTVVASGLQRCATGLARDPLKAKDVVVTFDPFAPVPVASGDVLALRVSTRIGTTPLGAKCTGPGGSHGASQGLRLYYDGDPARAFSRFDATITPNPSEDLYLHSDGSACPNGGGESPGVTTRFLNTTANLVVKPKCKDSGAVNFAGTNPFSTIGTWSLTLP